MNSPDDAREIEAILAHWFPPPAFVKAAPIGDHALAPEEAAIVARAVAKRRREFSTGRALAREGLRSIGLPETPIGVGRLHEPLWPADAIGSISHDGEICAVAIMRRSDAGQARFGVDLVTLSERGKMAKLAPLYVARDAELAAMEAFGLSVDPALLLFSLKESLVKAISAQVGEFLDLRDLEISDERSPKRRGERPAEPGRQVWPRAALRGAPLAMELRAAAGRRYVLTAALSPPAQSPKTAPLTGLAR
jgi:enterobactin synthetase component D